MKDNYRFSSKQQSMISSIGQKSPSFLSAIALNQCKKDQEEAERDVITY
jgi:hypothetical protein